MILYRCGFLFDLSKMGLKRRLRTEYTTIIAIRNSYWSPKSRVFCGKHFIAYDWVNVIIEHFVKTIQIILLVMIKYFGIRILLLHLFEFLLVDVNFLHGYRSFNFALFICVRFLVNFNGLIFPRL